MPDLTAAHHLPNLRRDREPPSQGWLPRQRRGTTPQMIGRYPDFDVFDAAGSWDPATRRVIEARMRLDGRALTFFGPDEEPPLRAFCDTALAQSEEPRVPVAEIVDEKLTAGRLDGYQYAGMPDDRDTWHLVLRGLDETARLRHGGTAFAELAAVDQEAIVGELAGGRLDGEVADQLNLERAWSVCMRMMLSAFYSHPWAWNEIGFGGPAYPRGFMRLGPVGIREPFERPGATDEDPVQIADIIERERP
ncbi:MAG: gluconate 2-dehydrogenase subunit 3 family protein [Candidatus Dormibacteraceae bacterium]